MTREELYNAIAKKYGDGKGIVRGLPVTVLFRLGYGITKEQWKSELTPEDIAFFIRGTDVTVDTL